MEMHQVRYFLAVAQELNFTRAAERCNVSQPSMTRAIRQLEHNLGGALFHRERQRIHLTDLGRIMSPYMQQIWRQAEDARRTAQRYGRAERAELSLGMMCTIAPATVLDLLRCMRIDHPEIELKVLDATAGELIRKLATGELEVAISSQPEPVPESLHRVVLYREQFTIVVASDHPLASRTAIRVKDLDGADYLDRVNCEYAGVAQGVFAQQGVSDRTVYASDRDDWILAMAAAGLGYAFMPEQCARYPGAVARPLVEPEIWREVGLFTVRGRPHSAPLGALVREAMRLYRQTGAGMAADPGDTGSEEG